MTTEFSQYRGRRQARPLRAARSSAMAAHLPRYEIKLDELTSPLTGEVGEHSETGEGVNSINQHPHLPIASAMGLSREGRGDNKFASLFTSIWLEIGFGGGEHLMEQARRHPDIGFIGCEPFVNGVSSLMLALEAEPLPNIRVYTDDVRFLLKALPDRLIGRIFILFADPWPKKRHHKRRIVNPDTLTDMARILTPDGDICLATDDPGLQDWYQEVVPAHGAFALKPAAGDSFASRPADWPETRYEQKAIGAGRAPRYYRSHKLLAS